LLPVDLRDDKQFFLDHPGAVPITTAQVSAAASHPNYRISSLPCLLSSIVDTIMSAHIKEIKNFFFSFERVRS
jgi:hypothetical protein